MKFTVLLLLPAMIVLSKAAEESFQEGKEDDVENSSLANNSSGSHLTGIKEASKTSAGQKPSNENYKTVEVHSRDGGKTDKVQKVSYRHVRSAKGQDISNPKQESLGYGYEGFGGYDGYGGFGGYGGYGGIGGYGGYGGFRGYGPGYTPGYAPGYWLPGMTGYGAGMAGYGSGLIGGYKPICRRKIPRFSIIPYIPNAYPPPAFGQPYGIPAGQPYGIFGQPYGIPTIDRQYDGSVIYGQSYGTPDTYGKYGGSVKNGQFDESDNYKPHSYGSKPSCKKSPYRCLFGRILRRLFGGKPPIGGEPPIGGKPPPAGGGETPPEADGGMPPEGGEMPPEGGEMPPEGGEMPPEGGGEMLPESGGEMPPESGGEIPPEAGGGEPPPEGAPAEGGNRPLTYPGMYLSNTYADMHQPQYYRPDDYNQRRRRYAPAYEPYQGYASGIEQNTLVNEFKRKTSGHENTFGRFSRLTGYGLIDDRYRYIPYKKAAINYTPKWEKFITYKYAFEPEASDYSPPKLDDFNSETNDAGRRSDEYGYDMRAITAEGNANGQASHENYSVRKEKREGNVHKNAAYDRSYYKETYDINDDDGQYIFVGEQHGPKVDRRSPLKLSNEIDSYAWNEANLKPVAYEAPHYRSIAGFYSGLNQNTNKRVWSGEPFAKYSALGIYDGGYGNNIAGRNYYSNRYSSDASMRGQGDI